MRAPKPPNEGERLKALEALHVLDTPPEESFDRITRLAAQMLGAPIVLVSLVDGDRQWFKSATGLDATQTPRDVAFCAHAILDTEVFVVPDTQKDERFVDNPLVTGAPDIRFYAGAPLMLSNDIRLGTLCAIDRRPREFLPHQQEALRDLAAVVVDELRLRRIVEQQAQAQAALEAQAVELQNANRVLEQFAYMASHDLRSPLKSIINLADMILIDAEVSDGRRVEQIRNAAFGLETMVAGFGRLARMQASTLEVRRASQLIAGAVEQIGNVCEVEVRTDAPVRCDPDLMTQVFVNLIKNASIYASDNKLVFEADASEGALTIQATNAVNAAVPVDESIFAPFRRMTSKGDGSGMGLAIVDRVVQLHGGTVAASSTADAFVVKVTLPAAAIP